MATVAGKINDQVNLGKEINELASTFKKETKTNLENIQLVRKYIDELNKKWSQFKENDKTIGENKDKSLEAKYFTEKYYEKIHKIVIDMRDTARKLPIMTNPELGSTSNNDNIEEKTEDNKKRKRSIIFRRKKIKRL